MVDIYKREDDQRDTLLSVFNDHKMPIKLTVIGNFTGGDLSIGKFRFLIAEFNNEIGSECFFKPPFTSSRQRGTLLLNISIPFYPEYSKAQVEEA